MRRTALDPTARRAAVGEMTLAGDSTPTIAERLGIARSTVQRDRRILGLEHIHDHDHEPRNQDVVRLTKEGLDVAEIAARLNYSETRIYQIQIERGLRMSTEPTPAMIRGIAKRVVKLKEAAARRNREHVRCHHCGAPADPENRLRRLDWCDSCLITHAGDADPHYEEREHEAALAGYSRQSAIADATLWAPGAYTGGGNLARQVGKAARKIGAVRAQVRGAAMSLDEQRASGERAKEAYRAERLANLAPFGRRDGKEAGR